MLIAEGRRKEATALVYTLKIISKSRLSKHFKE